MIFIICRLLCKSFSCLKTMRKYKQLIFLSNPLFYSLLAKSGLLSTIQFYWHTAICVHAFTYILFYACFFTIKAESLVVGTDTIWPTKPKSKYWFLFFREKFHWLLIWLFFLNWTPCWILHSLPILSAYNPTEVLMNSKK